MNIDKSSTDYCYYIARKNIKRYRLKAGITAQDLADKSNLSHQYIRCLESLKVVKRPRLDTLYIIARSLNIELKELFEENTD